MNGYRKSSPDCRPAPGLLLTNHGVSQVNANAGIKTWLNGKLIHANNINRGIPEEPNTVTVTLKKGTNHLMLKVTDDILSWGAIVRLQE